MADLIGHYTWVLSLSAGELRLVADALAIAATNRESPLGPGDRAAAQRLVDTLLQKRVNLIPPGPPVPQGSTGPRIKSTEPTPPRRVDPRRRSATLVSTPKR